MSTFDNLKAQLKENKGTSTGAGLQTAPSGTFEKLKAQLKKPAVGMIDPAIGEAQRISAIMNSDEMKAATLGLSLPTAPPALTTTPTAAPGRLTREYVDQRKQQLDDEIVGLQDQLSKVVVTLQDPNSIREHDRLAAEIKSRNDEMTNLEYALTAQGDADTLRKLSGATAQPDFDQYVQAGESLEIEAYPSFGESVREMFDPNHTIKSRIGYMTSPEYKTMIDAARYESSNASDDVYDRLPYLTDAERDILMYYAGKGDWASARSYLDVLTYDLGVRRAEVENKKEQDWANEHPWQAAGKNVAASPFRGVGYVASAIQVVKNRVTGNYEKLDVNGVVFQPTRTVQNTTVGITRDMDPVAATAAQIGLSVTQYAVSLPFGQAPALLILSTGAASDTAYQATLNGATPEQALAYATAAGAIEFLTEKIPLDNLFDIAKQFGKKGVYNTLKSLAKQSGIEGIEEVIAEYANAVADMAIMGDKSQLENMVADLMAQGYTEEEARRKALVQTYAVNPAIALIGGVTSGLAMAGGANIVSSVSNYRNRSGLGKEFKALDAVGDVVQTGLESAPETEAYRKAKELQAQIDAGKNISNADIGGLYLENVRTVAEEEKNLKLQPAETAEETPLETALAASAEGNNITLPGVPAKGGSVYVTAGEAGEVSDGSGQRDAGLGTGRQARRLAEGTGRDQSGYAEAERGLQGQAESGNRAADQGSVNQSKTAAEIRRAVNEKVTERKSTASYGIPNGTEDEVLAEVPAELWTDEMKSVSEEMTGRGVQVVYFTGAMRVQAKDGIVNPNGVSIGNRILIRADDPRRSVRQLADHEHIHNALRGKQDQVNLALKAITDSAVGDEIDALLNAYVGGYSGLENYDMDAIMEEIVADAYAGINRYNAGATKFTEAVRAALNETAGPVRQLQKQKGKRAPLKKSQAEAPKDEYSELFSLEDSEGNTLTPEQAEFFKDSKVRDEDGNLLVVYHGTPNGGFTVFDPKYLSMESRTSQQGTGFYFTDNQKWAKEYLVNVDVYGRTSKGRNPTMYETYLNIKNPVDITGGKRTLTDQQLRDIIAQSDYQFGKEWWRWYLLNDKTRSDEEGIQAYLDYVKEKSDKTILQDIHKWFRYNDAVVLLSAFREATGYDGIVEHLKSGDIWVATDSVQIKNVDNTAPTANPDIRFSLKEPVEEDGDLIAVHNLSEDNLRGALDIGGFPMPSVAIIKAGTEHSRYGSISIVFGKETINPTNRQNKIYGGDAYTPTFPAVNYKLDDKKQRAIYKRVRDALEDEGYGYTFPISLDDDNMEDYANRHDGDLVKAYRNQAALKLAFLKESGIDFEAARRSKVYDGGGGLPAVGNEAILHLADVMGSRIVDATYESADALIALGSEIRDTINEWYVEHKGRAHLNPEKELHFQRLDQLARAVREIMRDRANGSAKWEIDKYGTEDKLRDLFNGDAALQEQYDRWLKDLFTGVIQKKGIRNNTDWFTSSGNRRSFEATHWEYTLENIVRSMTAEENQKGKGALGTMSIYGASAKEFSTIPAVKKESGRLRKISDEEMQAAKDSFDARFKEIVDRFSGSKDWWDAATIICEAASRQTTRSGILRYLNQWPSIYKANDAVADDLVSLIADIQQMPTEYFEAKPRRAVMFNEILGVVVPDNLPADLREGLERRRVKVLDYTAGDEQSRIEAVNQVPEARFSLEDEDREYAPVFYSKMQRAIEGFKGDKLGAGSLESYLLGRGVDKDEIKWSGIRQFLQGKKSVTKDEILDFMRGNEIRLEETTLGVFAVDEARRQELYDQAEEYRNYYNQKVKEIETEFLTAFDPADVGYSWDNLYSFVDTTIRENVKTRIGNAFASLAQRDPNADFASYAEPFTKMTTLADEAAELALMHSSTMSQYRYAGEPQGLRTKFSEYKLDGGENYREILFRLPGAKPTPDQPHWEQKDVLAHTRVQDFTAADGGKVLFVDEVQSDWHEQGREQGYKGDAVELFPDWSIKQEGPEMWRIYDENGVWQYAGHTREEVLGKFANRRDEFSKRVPDAPFREDWHEYVLKRLLRMAAEGEYDYMAWSTGQMQADRYDLSKDINYIEARKTSNAGEYYLDTGTNGGMQIPQASGYMSEKRIIELFGKDLGRRLIEGANANGKILITDDGLTIGGEGMKNFYDIGGKSSQNIPRFLQKYVKPWGSNIQEIEIITGQERALDPEREHRLIFAWDGEAVAADEDEIQDTYETVPAVEITEAMKESVLYEGQARFSVEEDSEEPDIRYSVADDTASYTEEKVQKLYDYFSVKDTSYHRDYAQRYVAYISPDEFLDLTATDRYRPRLEAEAAERYGQVDPEILKEDASAPYLEFDINNGRVVGHEGRHRMVLLKNQGIKKVAITLEPYPMSEGKYERKPFDNLTLFGQQFQSGTAPGVVQLENVLPLSNRYKQDVIENYAVPAGVRYSIERSMPTKREYMQAARRDFANNLLDAFNVQANRKEVREKINELTYGLVFVDYIGEKRLKELFDVLYNAGVVKQISDRYAEDVRRFLKGSKIYVPDRVKHEFGDDWNIVRMSAFGNGIYFVDDKSAVKLDSKYAELANEFGGIFSKDETDEAQMISNMLDIVEFGKPKAMALEEAAFNEGGQEAVAAQIEYLDGIFRREFNKLASKWRIESNLKPKKELIKMTAKERVAYLRQLYGLDAPAADFKLRLAQMGDVPEGTTIDEYTQKLTDQAAQDKADRIRFIAKEDFRATPSLEQLGVKVDGGVADYSMTDALLRRDRAAKSVKKETKKAEKRLNASPGEMKFASGVAAGIYAEGDIPKTMDAENVMELADYYAAEAALGEDMIKARRRSINRVQMEAAEEHFGLAEQFKSSPLILINNRTPQRNMRTMFGDDKGRELSAYYFDPVGRNSAEMNRFVNAQYDKVRTFKGRDGKQSKLTKEESALVQQVLEGKAVAETVAGMEISASIKRAAINITKGAGVPDAVKEFGIMGDDVKLTTKYARWLQTQKTISEGNFDSAKIESAAKIFADLFDQYYKAINDFLVAHGYEPIGWIKGYAPHMQPEANLNVLMSALEALGINTDVTKLPANIAGLTADYKPNKRWNPYFLHRTTDETEYDITAAFQSYVVYMANVLYHTDDIMRIRQASTYLRSTYAPENLKADIDWAKGLRDARTDVKLAALKDAGEVARDSVLSDQEVSERLDQYVERLFGQVEDTTKFSDLVMYLDNYANILAGKQNLVDRGWEYGVARRVLNIGNKLNAAFARAQVAGNLSSALNQTSQLSLIISENGAGNTLMALKDILTGKLRRAAWAQESDFLTGKKGVDYIVMEPADMIVKTLFTPLELMDRLTATLAVRGRYLKELRSGTPEDKAVRKADRFARDLMGSRLKGERPLGFEAKNPLSQVLHVFQLEVTNAWDHIISDIPADFRRIEREKGKAAAGRALAAVIIKALLSAFVINRLAEELYGGTPAMFDLGGLSANFIASGLGLSTNDYLRMAIDNAWEKITGERLFDTEALDPDREFEWGRAAEDLAFNATNDIPFIRNAAGVLGWGDQTLPMIDIPEITQNMRGLALALLPPKNENGERAKPDWIGAGEELVDLLGKVLPGGRQLSKTFQGVEALLRGGYIKGGGDKERLQYPIEGDAGDWFQAGLFGRSGLNETADFYASGESGLTESQTKVWHNLVAVGADKTKAWQALMDIRHAGDVPETDRILDADGEPMGDAWYERAALAMSGITEKQKAALYYDTMAGKEEMALMKNLEAAGANMAEVYKVLSAMKDSDAELNGVEASNEKRSILADASLSDAEKIEIYTEKISASRADEIQAIMSAGVSFKKYLDVYNQYATIDEEFDEDGAQRKAIEFDDYLRSGSGLTETQQQAFRENLVYYSASPQEARTYGKLAGTGLDSRASYDLAVAIDALEPEEGKTAVQDIQKYEAIAGSGLNLDQQMQAMSAVMDEGTYKKLTAAYRYDVTPSAYAAVQRNLDAINAGKSINQEEAKKAVQMIPGLSSAARAALWAILGPRGKSAWSAGNNPFSSKVGASMRAALKAIVVSEGTEETAGTNLTLGTLGSAPATSTAPGGTNLTLPGLK